MLMLDKISQQANFGFTRLALPSLPHHSRSTKPGSRQQLCIFGGACVTPVTMTHVSLAKVGRLVAGKYWQAV